MNAAQRLESLGKTLDPNAETIVLISGEIAEALPPGFQLIDQGPHLVKGKREPLHTKLR